MKKSCILFIFIAITIASYSLLYSQTLKLVRTDVDSTRSNFVTATYLFGFDVIADGVNKCNEVTFELRFDNIDNIQFSEWHIGKFGKHPAAVVIPIIDRTAGYTKIYISVISGEPVDSATTDNPNVIHLDFAVSQSAPNDGVVNFTFINPIAVVKGDSAGTILPLTVDPIAYNIHGLIDVYPGDTDNNGVVDNRDFANIGLFYGYGSTIKLMRSFKRPNASTVWYPQKVLAWDSTIVSYSDCDGNGSITTTDLLVVGYNMSKLHSAQKNQNDNIQFNNYLRNHESCITTNSKLIPVYVNSSKPFIGISGVMSYSSIADNTKVLGIDPAGTFDENESFFYYFDNPKEKVFEFSLGSIVHSTQAQNKPIAYLIVENYNNNDGIPQLSDINCISSSGEFFTTDAVSSIMDNSMNNTAHQINISQKHNLLQINLQASSNDIISIQIFNMLGNCVRKPEPESNIINLSYLPSGLYFIVAKTQSMSFSKTIFIE